MPDESTSLPDDLIDTREAANILKLSVRTLQQWRMAPEGLRRIPYFFDGYRVKYARSDVEQYKEKRYRKVGA